MTLLYLYLLVLSTTVSVLTEHFLVISLAVMTSYIASTKLEINKSRLGYCANQACLQHNGRISRFRPIRRDTSS
ncbi:hypothetical protein BC826DRAFT_1035937 [Russula brevipes]|nr:hypothetical protein BC826DRAFT_1035937 [Russula brevipes]